MCVCGHRGILRGRVLAATPSRAQRSRRGLHARALAHAYAQPTHPDACLQRWRYSVDPTIRRGKWTVEEDGMLRQGVAQHGAKEWARWVPGHMNGRTAPQCRERWVNSLDPNKRAVIEAPWTAEEDAALVEAVELLGTEEVERGAAPGTPAVA